VSLIGFKVGINTESTATLKDFIYLDDYVLETNPPIIFDFEQLELERDFQAIKSLTDGKLSVARVFIFADGRAAPEFANDGSVTEFDKFFYQDFDELVSIAARNGIMLMPVLLDFLWCDRAKEVSRVQLGGHSDIIKNLSKRRTFLDRALKPLLQRYGTNPTIFAWDIINEPEWVMEGVPEEIPEGLDPEFVTVQQMRDFVKACAEYVHRYTSHRATVGSARQMWLRYWRGLGLDLYQFHWYDHFSSEEPFPWRSYSELGLDKPCIIGEVPTSTTNYSAREYLDAALELGYSGLLFWSCRARDAFSNLRAATPDIISWCDRRQVC
jgi:hypothetical protein